MIHMIHRILLDVWCSLGITYLIFDVWHTSYVRHFIVWCKVVFSVLYTTTYFTFDAWCALGLTYLNFDVWRTSYDIQHWCKVVYSVYSVQYTTWRMMCLRSDIPYIWRMTHLVRLMSDVWHFIDIKWFIVSHILLYISLWHMMFLRYEIPYIWCMTYLLWCLTYDISLT